MIHAAEAVQREFVEASQMYSAIDYTTKCGVGIAAPAHRLMDAEFALTGPSLIRSR